MVPKNCMEKIVEDNLDKVLRQYTNCCTCDKCKQDIMSLALNNLPPRYVSSYKGDVYMRVHEMESQHEIEVIKAIARAVEIVSKNPRHDNN